MGPFVCLTLNEEKCGSPRVGSDRGEVCVPVGPFVRFSLTEVKYESYITGWVLPHLPYKPCGCEALQ